MFYDKKAEILTTESISDGMGGWIDSGEVVLAEIRVETAPVSAEVVLREYGVISTSSLKIYTEDDLPDLDGKPYHLSIKDKSYRVIQFSDYGKEKIFLVELMK